MSSFSYKHLFIYGHKVLLILYYVSRTVVLIAMYISNSKIKFILIPYRCVLDAVDTHILKIISIIYYTLPKVTIRILGFLLH